VASTARIERGPAVGTLVVAVEIGFDAQLGSTLPAQHRWLVEPVPGPPLGVVVDTRLVATETRIVRLTAGEPDRNYVSVGVVVGTPGVGVDPDPDDQRSLRRQAAATVGVIGGHWWSAGGSRGCDLGFITTDVVHLLMTTFVVATNSVHTSAALCDYLVDRVGDEDTVHAINSHPDAESATDEELRDGEDALNAIYARLGAQTTVETRQFVRGNVPAEDILSFADEVDADEIALGVRKPTPTSKVAIGSVTEQVLLHSSRPMAVIPRELE